MPMDNLEVGVYAKALLERGGGGERGINGIQVQNLPWQQVAQKSFADPVARGGCREHVAYWLQVARLARQLPTGSIQMVQLGPAPGIQTDDLDADDLT